MFTLKTAFLRFPYETTGATDNMKKFFTSTGVPITEPLLLMMEVNGTAQSRVGDAERKAWYCRTAFCNYNKLNDTAKTDDGDFIINEYCGYHVGNEFHQSDDKSKMPTDNTGWKKDGRNHDSP